MLHQYEVDPSNRRFKKVTTLHVEKFIKKEEEHARKIKVAPIYIYIIGEGHSYFLRLCQWGKVEELRINERQMSTYEYTDILN